MFLVVVMVTALDAEVKNEIFDTIPIILVKPETLFDNKYSIEGTTLICTLQEILKKLDFVYLHLAQVIV